MLARNPFALSLSKGCARAMGFDKLSPNGGVSPFALRYRRAGVGLRYLSPNGLGAAQC